jgi:hypothetical protein
MKSLIRYFPLFTVLIFISGCFDVKREIKMYPSGGGVEDVYITLDKQFFDTYQEYAAQDQTHKAKWRLDSLNDNYLLEAWITSGIQRAPGTSIKEFKVTSNPDGSKDVYFQYIFDDPAVLLNTVKEVTYPFSNQLNIIFSTMKFTLEDDNLKFKYIIRKANRAFDDELALNVFSGLLQSKIVTHSFEFPFQVNTSNAHNQAGNIVTWSFLMNDIVHSQVEMTAEMTPEKGIDLPYAEKIEKEITKIDKKSSPIIRVQVYNANQEPVKIGTGVVLKEDLLVTNFELMNIMEGRGFFSVILSNDSLAGIDEMREKDLVPQLDLVFMRFNNWEKVKTVKYAPMEISSGTKVKIFYFPNPLSSIVYSMEGTITATKKWSKKNKIIEVKPAKPLSLEGGAVYNENGELVGMITRSYSGEVGKLYVIPALYIRAQIK